MAERTRAELTPHEDELGPTAAQGFRAAGVRCGIRSNADGPDLALLVSSGDATAAGVFTQNAVAAAPVLLDRETLAENAHRIRAVVTNAAVANACTGAAGLADARVVQARTAETVGCEPGQVLVLSTGVIGVRLDLDRIQAGIATAAGALSPRGGPDAARAIMTTDTRPKLISTTVEFGGASEGPAVTIGGMAKGSGMIHPDMATMLALITTDARVPPDTLQRLLGEVVHRTFNRISVDGDTSTNDTVLLLASGASGVAPTGVALDGFAAALESVCSYLAREIARDGEGASRLVSIEVNGARTEEEAAHVGRVIATSALVKTAFAGGDPNWGRILAAAGRAGVPLDPDRLSLAVTAHGGTELRLVEDGMPRDYDECAAAAIFAAREVHVTVGLAAGKASATVWTCDLTHEYVTINSSYRT